MEQNGNMLLSGHSILKRCCPLSSPITLDYKIQTIWDIKNNSDNYNGYIKINNFQKNPNKINYIYVLTPRGITEKTKLTINFMKRKMKEYDELKKELEKNK